MKVASMLAGWLVLEHAFSTIAQVDVKNIKDYQLDSIDVLLNDSRNQFHCHIPVLIGSSDKGADPILLSGHPVVVAAMGNSIDANREADENSAIVVRLYCVILAY